MHATVTVKNNPIFKILHWQISKEIFCQNYASEKALKLVDFLPGYAFVFFVSIHIAGIINDLALHTADTPPPCFRCH